VRSSIVSRFLRNLKEFVSWQEPAFAIYSSIKNYFYKERIAMLHYAIVFLVIALIAALFGFGGLAAGAAGIAKILFVVFLIGAIVSFLMHSRSRV
jgi:uncharacterized membrane protein YtjA (UPF0391 family)